MQQQLRTPLTLALSGVPLREGIAKLSQATRVAMWLDRRVDPSQPLDLRLEEVPLRQALDALAVDHQLAWRQIGPVVYFGPAGEAERLKKGEAARLEQLGQLPTALRRRLLAARAWQWDELAEPRSLFAELADENRITLVGLDHVTHDLWPAADLPPLSLLDRIVLIAIQFELEVDIAQRGAKIELRPHSEVATDSRAQPRRP